MTQVRALIQARACPIARLARRPRVSEPALWEACLTVGLLTGYPPRLILARSMQCEPEAWADRDMTIYLAPPSAEP